MRNARLDEGQAGIKIAQRAPDRAASKQEEEPTSQRQPGGSWGGLPTRLPPPSPEMSGRRGPSVSPTGAPWNRGSQALELRGKEVLTGAQRDAPPPLRLPSHPPIFPPPQGPSGPHPPPSPLTPFPAPECDFLSPPRIPVQGYPHGAPSALCAGVQGLWGAHPEPSWPQSARGEQDSTSRSLWRAGLCDAIRGWWQTPRLLWTCVGVRWRCWRRCLWLAAVPCASTSLKPTARLPVLRKMALVGVEEAAGMWARGTECLSVRPSSPTCGHRPLMPRAGWWWIWIDTACAYMLLSQTGQAWDPCPGTGQTEKEGAGCWKTSGVTWVLWASV